MKTIRTIWKFFPLVLTAIILSGFLACQTGAKALYGDLGRASSPVPFMQNARTGVLPSGLRYYILENSMPQGRAFLTLAVNAGSVLETENERGLAHFVEHMAFNGTERFPEADLVNYLRSLGMRFGPEINAYTSFDETVYGIEVPVETVDGRRRIPDTALAVIDDWTRAITFAPSDVDDERPVILEEYRARLGAAERIQRQMLPLIFKGSPYADRLPIGLPDVIENAPAELLEGFYKKWYRPDNMALIFVGDFDAELLESSLTDHFHITKAATPLNRPRYSLPEPKKGSFQTMIQTDPEYTQTRVDLYFKQKAEIPRSDLAGYRNDVIAYLANTIISFRFNEAASKPETPYMVAASGTASYGYGSGYYVLIAIAKSGQTSQVVEELLRVKESLSRYGFLEDEMDMSKRALLSAMEQMAAEKDKQNSSFYVDAFTRHFIEGESVPDIEWELEAIRTLLPGISLKELNTAIKNKFADDDLTVFIYGPDSERQSLPTEDQIRTMTANVKRAVIAPPVSTIIKGELLENTPVPGSILGEVVDEETGATYWLLSNGMEVLLKETTNRNNEISFYALAKGGTMSVPEKYDVSVGLAAEMLNASGLGPYTRPELIRKLVDKQVSYSFWTSSFIRGLQGGAARGDVKVLMEMIYLGFTQPKLDTDAVSILLDEMRTFIIQEAEDPDSYFSREIAKTEYGNPRFHPIEAADLDRASMDEALDFIRMSLNPMDYTFVFVGSLSPDELRPLVETYLASIPVKEIAFNDWAEVDYQRPANVQREVRKGKEERSTVYISWALPMDYSEQAMAASAVLNEYLNIRLIEEIRETLGGVYSISPWVSISPLPKGELTGGLYFVCSPERAKELAEAAVNQIREVSLGNINADTLNKSREAQVMSHEQSIQSNFYIAQSYANSMVIYESPLTRMDRRPTLYQAVTAADIQRLASSLLAGSMVEMILYPEDR